MAGLISELIGNINEQSEVYDSLLELAGKKKVAVIANDIEKLQSIVDEENVLLGRIGRLDKSRVQLFKDIAFVLNKKDEDISLNKLMDLIKGQSEENELRKAKEELFDKAGRLKTLNEQNQKLIEYSLEHIDFSMNVIRSALSNKPSYCDAMGNELSDSSQRMFDTKQ
ncbi:MAG: flagellar protein FlgN [Firmicutes bacterium]|jgi:flagellar biosynthesis/type III secretory pathway chaperone|nr:flagellar protein FlgN [Bacillota bacterium]